MLLLLIDDDHDIHEFLSPYLISTGFEVISTYSGKEGIELVRTMPVDLVILDVQIPYMDGWEICQEIRKLSSVPILMISAVAQQDEDIVHGLTLGADDYLVKPLRMHVLGARIQALLRRANHRFWQEESSIYVDNRLLVDLSREMLFVNGARVALSHLEYRLLELLLKNRGQAVPTLEIIEDLWSESAGDNYINYVRIYIKRLRNIIEPVPAQPTYILTEHGFGYRFAPSP